MRSSEVMKELNISFLTLKNLEKNSILVPKRNDMGWRVYDPAQVLKVKSKLTKKRGRGVSIFVK